MKKILKITVVNTNWDKEIVNFKITKQSHRGYAFGDISHCESGDMFSTTQSNGSITRKIDLVSMDFPEFNFGPGCITLYVRGEHTKADDEIVTCSIEQFILIKKAVWRYNHHNFTDLTHTIKIDNSKNITIDDHDFVELTEWLACKGKYINPVEKLKFKARRI